MIDDLDEALRQLLIRELPIKKSEVDVKFDQPSREWSAKLSRPTLNFFLYDMRENVKLRQPSPQWVPEPLDDNNVSLKRRPVRVDLYYAVTAWARAPEDEHRMLTLTLMALFRTPFFPEDLLPESLQDQSAPIAIQVAQHDALQNPSDFWSALDNEIRPAIPCTITMALNPYQAVVTPVVGERELRFFDTDTGRTESGGPEFWTVGGTLHGSTPMRQVRMTLLEREQKVRVQRDGTFVIKGLPAGEYTLEISTGDGKPSRRKIAVPAPDYDLEI